MRMVQQNLCVYLDDGEYDDDGDVNDNDGDDGSPAPPAEYLVFKRGGGGGLPSTTNQPQTDPQHLKI